MFISSLNAFDEFLVSDIRIIGLQRVSTGSIFNTIPISVGDKIDSRKIVDITKALFATEQFDDIQVGRDGNALIITVVERPSISSIEISGNSALKTEVLLDSFVGIGITEGQVYKRSTLEMMKSELVRSYSSQGRYGAGVEIFETPQPRNRIAVSIEIDEGDNNEEKAITYILHEFLFSVTGEGDSVTWDFGDGITRTGRGPHTITYSQAGSKDVSLTVDGIEKSYSDFLKINAIPSISVSSLTAQCEGTINLSNYVTKSAGTTLSFYSDMSLNNAISSEVSSSGTNYTAGGNALTRVDPTTSGTTAFTDFADLTFSTATITANGALIYNSSASDKAVIVLAFGGDKTSTAGDFTIQFPTADASNAIIRIA